MTRFPPSLRWGLLFSVFAILPLTLPGCGGGGGGEGQFVSIGTATQGGAFYQVGAAIANALNEGKEEGGWKKVTAESTAGSLENLRRLESKEIQIGMSNSSITYFAVRGQGEFDKKYDVKSIMTLFPLIAMFVTREDSGIKSIKDLVGRRVVIGPEGAGFRNFVEPILEAHGVKWSDLNVSYQSFSQSASALQDKQVDAAFLGGGLKSPAITSAATSVAIRLIPYDEAAKRKLIEEYPSFNAVTVPAATYKGQTADFHGLNVGSAQLLVRSDTPDDFVKNVIKVIWEHREKIAQTHNAGKSINPKNVTRYTGVEFHPAAKEFYKNHKEIQWSGDAPGDSQNSK